MKNKNKLNEGEKFELSVTKDDLKDPQTTKQLADLQKANKNLEVTLSQDKESGPSISDLFETDGVIEPQDKATIKYLSNVKDVNTGKVSQPFTIADKNYQMIRGIDPKGEIVMAVYCLDDMDDEGNNIIHSIEEFEQKVALPMKERLEMENTKTKEDTYEGYKHFFVNKKTNEVRKFKSIDEMLACGKNEDEEYMPTTKFKRYMTEKLFGKRRVNELGMDQANLEPADGDKNKIATSDEDMTAKANRLMDVIDDNPKIQAALKTIKSNPKAQKEVIAAFAELVGVPRNGLSNLVTQVKDTSKEPTNESVVITKKKLEETFNKKRNVIKTIKVKDIK